jgi:hypothetical protein
MPLTSITRTKTANNNYEWTYNGSTKNGKTHLGQVGNNKFIPRLTFGAWDECQIVLTLDSNVTGNIANSLTENADGSLSVGNNNFGFWYNPTNVKEGFNDEGGMDFILTLKKKPGNVYQLPFTYNHTLVTAYFQPPLTQEQIDAGDQQPDYVTNSIAFYHATQSGNYIGGKNYATGKVGHLYRLRATDSSATPKTTWCDWSLAGDIITLTVPPTFLNTATYPVIIAPVGDTFGFLTAGGSTRILMTQDGTPTTYLQGSLFTAGSAGDVTEMSAWLRCDSANVGNHNAKVGIYLHSDLSKVVGGNSATVALTGTSAKKDFAISASITATDYVLSVRGQELVGGDWSFTSIYVAYDAGAANQGHTSSLAYASAWPSTWSSPTHSTNKISVYATYTPAAGGWTNIKNIRAGTGSITATDLSHIWFGTTAVAVADIADINGVAV